MLLDRFQYFFSFNLEILWSFRFCTFLKWLSGPQKSNFIIFLWLGNLMGIPNPILYFPQMTLWTTKVQFPCLWTNLNNFSLTWKFDGDSKCDIVLYLKWLTGPQKFVIMIRCKFDFDIIWYSAMFAANLYLSIFVWSWYIELRFHECCHSCFNYGLGSLEFVKAILLYKYWFISQ